MSCTTGNGAVAVGGSIYAKVKPFRIMVLGQEGVGKTALVVRFITHRFIGEYERCSEKTYTFTKQVDKDMVQYEILDTAGIKDLDKTGLQSHIRWADGFILMYSVTDKCSFDECNRLKFLINYNKRRRRAKDYLSDDVPVVLVGNKNDLVYDRMIGTDNGQKLCHDLSCSNFREISVRENINEVESVFYDVYRYSKFNSKISILKRSMSDVHDPSSIFSSPEESTLRESMEAMSIRTSLKRSIKKSLRGRALTDEILSFHPQDYYATTPTVMFQPLKKKPERRLSVSTKGRKNANF